jgi:hypothetical protein
VTKKLSVFVAVLGLIVVDLNAQSQADINRLSGSWKLNVEKSKFNPGPGSKSQTLTWKLTATGFEFTVDTVTAQGQTTQSRASGTHDGKPYAFKTANYSGMRTTRWVDAYTIEETDTVDGRVRNSRTAVISKDGKVLTVTTKGINAQGQPTNNVVVYEKQ